MDRAAQPFRVGITQLAAETISDAIRADGEFGLTDRDEVQANASFELQLPIVWRHARNRVLKSNLPGRRHKAVLNPDSVILFTAQGTGEFGILQILVRVAAPR